MLKLLESLVDGEVYDCHDSWVMYCDATFKRDFGPFKKGQKVEFIRLKAYDHGVYLQQLDDEENIGPEVKVTLGVSHDV